mgnify:FL=1
MQGLVLALFGACVGSFTNVVAWRLPRQESVVVPSSHCPRCGHAVRWRDNLPVFGWLLLLGRCRDCRSPISVRYPLVEALSAGLWLSAAYVQSSGGGDLPAAVLPWAGLPLIALLLPLVVIDFDHMWLPEPLCRWGVLVGLAMSATAGVSVFVQHLIATVLALLALEGLSALAERLVGKPALGLGDAKLAAMGGAWLGLWGIGLAMGLAVLAGAVVGGLARITGRLAPQQPFPFGPFIALGIWLVWLMGPFWWWEQWQTALNPGLGL